MRRELERLEIPGEPETRVRSWEVVREAFAVREATPRARSWRPLALAAAVFAVLAAAVSPPGLAVLDGIREAVAVEAAEEPLVTLPAEGRVLVASHGGTWIVQPDGSRRRLGRYTSVTWSPRGLFVAATARAGLSALDPQGRVRWTLARRNPVWPRWAPSGFRIAYFSAGRLRVVAGDGTDDRLVAADTAPNPPAWSPAVNVHVLAYSDRDGRVHVVDVDTGRERWRSPPGEPAYQLDWSSDGTRLLALGARTLRVFQGNGTLLRTMRHRGAPAAVAFRPGGRVFAFAHGVETSRSDVVLLRAERGGDARTVFRGAGSFGAIAWSPDGTWLLVPWPSADQWIFVRVGTPPRIVTESEITSYFSPGAPGGVFPVLSGWCCSR